MEELRCIGCGSIIQSENPKQSGFVPNSKLNEQNEELVCRRCFRLRNYNEVVPTEITEDDFYKVVSEIGNTSSLVVKIIDMFDIEGSLIPQIAKLTNHNDLIIIANKIDLLPKSIKEGKLIHHLRKIMADNNLKPLSIHTMSAVKNKNLDKIMDDILEKADNRDIFVVGATNVGKSTFINSLLKSYAHSKKDVITVSSSAGTTLDLIKIKMGQQYIIDTPGIINNIQLTHYISQEDLKFVTPKKEIKPKGFQLDSQQTLFMGGLARIDFVEGSKTSFVCYVSEQLKVHRTKLERADQLYENHLGALLSPTFIEPVTLVKHRFLLKNKEQDLVLPGLGFITVRGSVKIDVYTHPKTTPYIRETLI